MRTFIYILSLHTQIYIYIYISYIYLVYFFFRLFHFFFFYTRLGAYAKRASSLIVTISGIGMPTSYAFFFYFALFIASWPLRRSKTALLSHLLYLRMFHPHASRFLRLLYALAVRQSRPLLLWHLQTQQIRVLRHFLHLSP